MNIFQEQQEVDGKPEKCSKCGSDLQYMGLGEYSCVSQKCNNIERDTFGKIRFFLAQNGPKPASEISKETGIPVNKITKYLEEGRLEFSRRNQNG